MSLKEFLRQYATPKSKVPLKEWDNRQLYVTNWMTLLFGSEFVEQATGHTRQVSDHEIWIIRDHCPDDGSFALVYEPDARLIQVHLIEGEYKSQTYSEFLCHQETKQNLTLLADALQQLIQAIKEEDSTQTTRLQKQMAEFNMRAQSWVPCDLEIYLMGQYAAAGLAPEQVVLKTKQLLHLLLNSEIAQPGSLCKPRVQAIIEKTLKKTKQANKEF